jgi:hypothetical protein
MGAIGVRVFRAMWGAVDPGRPGKHARVAEDILIEGGGGGINDYQEEKVIKHRKFRQPTPTHRRKFSKYFSTLCTSYLQLRSGVVWLVEFNSQSAE